MTDHLNHPAPAEPAEATGQPIDFSKAAPTAEAVPEPRRTGWHTVNIGHLVMGLAFLCLVGAWALVEADVVTGKDIQWLLPIPWLVAGAAGLIASAVSGARRHGVRR